MKKSFRLCYEIPYYALTLAILANMTPEQAFDYLTSDKQPGVPIVDIVSRGYSMGSILQFVALVAQAHRWGLSGKIPAFAKIFTYR